MFSRYICFPGVDNGSTLISLCDICRTLNFGRRWYHLYYYRILYVIINRHDCWTIMVVIRPMDSETWSLCIYIGLRTNGSLMAIVVCSYEYILWQICIIEWVGQLSFQYFLWWVAGVPVVMYLFSTSDLPSIMNSNQQRRDSYSSCEVIHSW